MKILQTKNLTKRFGNITAVDNLSVTIEQGNVFGILGPNGSGKTTTLAMILGLLKPSSGTFSWFEKTDGILVNEKIGSIIEQPNFYPYLSALENLKIVAEIRQINGNVSDEINRVLQKVNLLERQNYSVSTFSFGMKSRLALAATLLGDPEILVLDEPTNGLDPEGIAFVRQLIIEEAKLGKTVIIASHILDEVEKVCTDVLILKKGNLVISGKVSDVLKDEAKVHILSDDNKKLYELLVRNEIIETVDYDGDVMKVSLKQGCNVRQISEIAMNNRIVVTSLEVKKKTLEAGFLELVK